jgi:glutamate/tyrosine decarboxylase-like PLP-dependent enzyme
VAQNIDVAHSIAEVIREREDLELVREPELSIVVFKKLGWQLADYDRWSAKLLESGLGFVVPSSHRGEPNTRFAIVNPRTTVELLVSILDTMKDD